jgi:hypothetical protein
VPSNSIALTIASPISDRLHGLVRGDKAEIAREDDRTVLREETERCWVRGAPNARRRAGPFQSAIASCRVRGRPKPEFPFSPWSHPPCPDYAAC